MTHYVLTFRAQPHRTPTAEQEASWPAWFSQIGPSIADMGNRVGQARSVGYKGERDDALSGYIVVTDPGPGRSAARAGCAPAARPPAARSPLRCRRWLR